MSHLSKERVAQLAAEIRGVGESSRQIDASTHGRISYPAMCGGLQVVLKGLVLELAGKAAAAEIDAAFNAAYADPADGSAA